jgi:hypothetical protein
MEKKFYTLSLTGAGLAAAMFMGCLGTGQDSAGNTQDTQAALLSLAVKDSGDCSLLHARCAKAHGEGTDSAALTDSLVGACIIDTAEAHHILEDGAFEGRGGRGGHDGRGGPEGRGGHEGRPGHDGRGPLDSAARAALCDSLTAAVAAADTADSGYAELARHANHVCAEPKAPLDSAARAALCDSLKTSLAATDSTDAGFTELSHATHFACEEHRGPESIGPGRHAGGHRGGRGHRR